MAPFDRIRNLIGLIGKIGSILDGIDLDAILPIIEKIWDAIESLFPPGSVAPADVDAACASIQSTALTAEDEATLTAAGLDLAGIVALIKLIFELFRAIKG